MSLRRPRRVTVSRLFTAAGLSLAVDCAGSGQASDASVGDSNNSGTSQGHVGTDGDDLPYGPAIPIAAVLPQEILRCTPALLAAGQQPGCTYPLGSDIPTVQPTFSVAAGGDHQWTAEGRCCPPLASTQDEIQICRDDDEPLANHKLNRGCVLPKDATVAQVPPGADFNQVCCPQGASLAAEARRCDTTNMNLHLQEACMFPRSGQVATASLDMIYKNDVCCPKGLSVADGMASVFAAAPPAVGVGERPTCSAEEESKGLTIHECYYPINGQASTVVYGGGCCPTGQSRYTTR